MPRFLPRRPYLRRRARRRRMALQLILLVLLFLLVLPGYMIYKPPRLLIRYFAHRWPDVLFEFPSLPPSAGKVVALTIDDAPSAHTRDILRVLADNGARATFFGSFALFGNLSSLAVTGSNGAASAASRPW